MCYGVDCLGTNFSQAQTCAYVRFQNATEWTASVHTLHMPKPVITCVFNVIRNGLLRYILYTCPNLWWRSCSMCCRMDCYSVLQSIAKYYIVVLRATMYYNVLLRTTKVLPVLFHTTKYYTVLLRTTKYYAILLRTTKYCNVLHSTFPYYKVLQSITKYYKVSQSITK